MLVAEGGQIEVDPEGGEVTVWLRRPGLDDRGFQPVIDRTGTISGVIPLELRLGWEPDDGVVHIPVGDLSNVYGGHRIEDGDLLLVRVEHAELPADDFLFRIRRYGLVTRFGAGVLVRVPVLAGGGIELFRFVSLQGQVNLSSFLRDASETPWALAVGFDAVQFARYSRDAGSRLFRKNELEDR